MTFYSILLTVHIIAAVCGLGAAFAQPIISKAPKTVSQAMLCISINERVEKLAKYGSIILLITGLIFGALNPALFKQVWYIISIIIFISVQPIVAAVLPKKVKAQQELLANHEGKDESLPDSYHRINKEQQPFTLYTHLAAVVLIVLMVMKPF
ncbi:DUF2269 domain-containing protein [Bacillus sp. AG4(2022)]|uniref:DUF2269 domain-containing protein n=1 Tax=Bacillus sp. AG4(2022) TaxID=2962594 RepID=UPI00288160AF|nr:DUF2269 domain-containing protein [Bacillus sp. AG4(2022)]MDT0162250.1 DUF2269 domain-containing protein [Bacillus sp. AG4(2022)]